MSDRNSKGKFPARVSASMASSSSSDNMSTGSLPPPRPQQPFRESAFTGPGSTPGNAPQGESAAFDIFEWYPSYIQCQKYFLDHAQHSNPVQALAAFINILLPYQRQPNPVMNSSSAASPAVSPAGRSQPFQFGPTMPTSPSTTIPPVSLIPYLRRLVATAMDYPGVLHGFFGDSWVQGVGSLHEQERRNYLFAAKSGGWNSVKRDYDMGHLETVPFLRPLQGPTPAEIQAAERTWSEFLHFEDWVVSGDHEATVAGDQNSQRASRGGRPL